MKVMMIGWELPPENSGGLGVACLGLSRALVDNGIEVTFVLPRKHDFPYNFMKLVFADVEESSELFKNAYHSARLKKDGKLLNTPPGYVAAAYAYAERIASIVKKYNPDVIHAHDWMTYPAGIVAKKLTGKPLIAHVHSTEIDRTGGHSPNRHVFEIEKKGLAVADKILSVSQFTKDILINNYNLPKQKIDVVYNGINSTNLKLTPTLTIYKKLGYKIVLYLGRITLQKGPEYFIKAAKKVLEYEPKTLFIVVGSGDMLPVMINEAARSGILDKTIFTGFLRGEDKMRIFASSDLYVMPSVSEPFGITALEAISTNTPLLISKQSGVSEVIENALKVDFWDVEEMANKIIACLRMPEMKTNLVNQSIRELKYLTWDKSAKKCLNIYKQILAFQANRLAA